jgi:two-component system nitrate/nitrite response regulator NarL
MPIRLSKREREVLAVLQAHPSWGDKEIGGDLHISEYTVGFHLHSLFSKFGLHNRIDLVIEANQQGKDIVVQ